MLNDRHINKLLCLALLGLTSFVYSCSSSQEEEVVDPIEAAQIETTSASNDDSPYASEDDALSDYQAAEAMPEALGSNEITSESAIQETLGEDSMTDNNVAGQESLTENPLGDQLDELSVPQEMDTISESEMSAPSVADTTSNPSETEPSYPAADNAGASISDVAGDMMDESPGYPSEEVGLSETSPVGSEALMSESGDYGHYIVQPGDMLGFISLKVLGTSKLWQDLAQINNISDPANLQPGDVIRYPLNQRSQEYQSLAQSLPNETVTVEAGDTLSRIAGRVMGSKDYWRPLWRMNVDVIPDPNRIMVGQTLRYIDPKKQQAAIQEKGWHQFGH